MTDLHHDFSGPGCRTEEPTRLVRLQDQRKVLLREVLIEDRPLIEQGFDALSERSRNLRFLGPRKGLSDEELRQITDPTDETHIVIGALTHDQRGTYRVPVGLARFIRADANATDAECALTVVDAFQGLGAGRLLFETLARRAALCGVTTFTSLIHRDNHAIRGLFSRFGATMTRTNGAELEARIPIPAVVHAARY